MSGETAVGPMDLLTGPAPDKVQALGLWIRGSSGEAENAPQDEEFGSIGG